MSIYEPSPRSDYMLAVLRIVAGALFILFGTMKMFGWPPSPGPVPPIEPMSQLWIGALLEIAGGAAITLGLFTRPVAFVLAGEMAVAYFQFHHPQSFFPTVNGGIPAVLYCFLFLYLSFRGAGEWSVDRARSRHRVSRVSMEMRTS